MLCYVGLVELLLTCLVRLAMGLLQTRHATRRARTAIGFQLRGVFSRPLPRSISSSFRIYAKTFIWANRAKPNTDATKKSRELATRSLRRSISRSLRRRLKSMGCSSREWFSGQLVWL